MMFIFRKLNVINVWRVLNRSKLIVSLYLQSQLSLNNGLPAFVPLGSSKDFTENTFN